MLRNALFSILVLVMGRCYAQDRFFVLIQADNDQPFYVRMGEKTYSSSARGHLILSELESGTLSLAVGVPKSIFPEQAYSFSVGKDLELQLKDRGDQGWGLYDPVRQEFFAAGKPLAGGRIVHTEAGIKKDDAFSRLMAGVVGDTAVMYNSYAVEEPVKENPVVKGDTSRGADSASVVLRGKDAGKTAAGNAGGGAERRDADVGAANPAVVTKPTVGVPAGEGTSGGAGKQTGGAERGQIGPEGAAQGGTVVKLSERKTSKGLRLAFADRPRGRKADTVIIIIPIDSPVAVAAAAIDSGKVRTGKVAAMSEPALAADTIKDKSLAGAASSEQAVRRADSQMINKDRQAADTARAIHPTDSVVKTEDNTIHVYINSGRGKMADSLKKVASGKDSSLVKSVGGKDSGLVKGEERKAGDNAAVKDAAGKTAATRPEGYGAGKELYRKPDTSIAAAAARSQAASKLVVINSDCRNFATDYDVDKLRVKLLDLGKDEERILAAKKVFRTRCFTTKQVKALSEVFAIDSEKFKFLETAYPFVSDDRYRELTDVLTDPVYRGKFKAMTGQR